MSIITFLSLLGVALVLAFAKSATEGRPRGRFAPSIVWGGAPIRATADHSPASEILHCDSAVRGRA
jgi:hypothetical protein